MDFFQAQGFDFFCKLAKLKKGVDFIFVFAGLKISKNMNLIFLEVKHFLKSKNVDLIFSRLKKLQKY